MAIKHYRDLTIHILCMPQGMLLGVATFNVQALAKR